MIVIIMTQSHFRIPVHPIDWNTTEVEGAKHVEMPDH